MNNLKRRRLFQSGQDFDIYRGTGFVGDVKPHSHDFFQCMIVSEGCVIETQSGKTISQNAGEAFFTPRGTEHALKVSNMLTSYYCLSFSPVTAAKVFSRFRELRPSDLINNPVITLSKTDADGVYALCDYLIEEQKQTGEGSSSVGDLITESILTVILRAGYAMPKRDDISSSNDRIMENITTYIDENFTRDISTEELIRESHLSKTTLFDLFPQYTGMTIKKYIDEKRIHMAIELSFTTNDSWAKIAETVGYNEFSTFYRNFVKMVGTSPANYRKQAGFIFPEK